MSTILYGMINHKAESTYLGPAISAANYELWVAHWFKAAEQLAVDFDNEHLPATAEAVRQIILDNRRFCK